MDSPLEDLIASLEDQLLRAVARHAQAESARCYVEVLEVEERITRLQSALTVATERLAAERGWP